MRSAESRWPVRLLLFAGMLVCLSAAGAAGAQEAAASLPEYRTLPFLNIGSRTVVWFVAQLHLTFAAFVLGVPLFAVVIEIVGHASRSSRYDALAKDFVRLCLMAYSITALLGGALLFVLLILYPKVWNYLVQIFSPTMAVYALLLVAETLVLYLYYYLWDSLRDRGTRASPLSNLSRIAGWSFIALCVGFIVSEVFFSRILITDILLPLADSAGTAALLALGALTSLATVCLISERKLFHLCLGALLNVLGTTLMVTANLWLTFMMSPGHAALSEAGERITEWAIDTQTGELVSFLAAMLNETWQPINIHRFIANVCVGGIIVAAYAAARFLGTKNQEERAYYDWMGYTGNFVAMIALIPLPFAGYYLGREVYAWNAQMGVNMMGGYFSWFFIMQAILIAVMFLGANYYLWLGLGRIPGGRRYSKFIGWMELLLIGAFLVWLTPHNPVATRAEIVAIGGPFHPLLAPFGVMAFKLTSINLIILTTFLSFLFYRRANKEPPVRFEGRAQLGQALLVGALVVGVPLVGLLDFRDGTLDLLTLGALKLLLSAFVVGALVINLLLWRRSRGGDPGGLEASVGVIFQRALLALTFGVNLWLGYHGYLSDDVTRLGDSVWQVVWVLSCMVLVTMTDAFLLLPARSLGEIRWGDMPNRSQYVLIMIAVSFVLTMALMGTVRSGLRGPWHVFGYMKDTSPEFYHPSLLFSAEMWAASVFAFFLLVSFIFWLGTQAEHVQDSENR